MCKGAFALPEQKVESKPEKEAKNQLKIRRAKYLYSEGYSMRGIAKIMGYKSVRSIQVLLNK